MQAQGVLARVTPRAWGMAQLGAIHWSGFWSFGSSQPQVLSHHRVLALIPLMTPHVNLELSCFLIWFCVMRVTV